MIIDAASALVGVELIIETSPGIFIEKDSNVFKFLNRMMGISVEMQNRLFKYFFDTLFATINKSS